ncbi:hypothetical protein VKT23_004800 [Stygiomarasmius scandens]|uniref:Uncharacterized protein n=1 Tax=Marasmiellus scandens TaxID=2682957 RepID=A0ABR1JR98_9AGAR
MKFSTLTIAALFSAALATPVTLEETTTTDNLTLVYSQAIDKNGIKGVYELWSDDSKPLDTEETSSSPSELSKRCGSNRIECDFSVALARSSLCGQLMDIMGDPANSGLSMSPFTTQCFTATDIDTNNVCCIVWPKKINGLKVRDLFGAAAPTLSSCTSNGLISGKAFDVNLA